jgi:hypothetical protein
VSGGGGSQHTHQPKNQAFLPSSSTHPLALGIQKKILPGAGGVFLIRGKLEVKVPVQSETTAHQEAAAGASRSQGSATRDDATTSRGKQVWEVQREATQQPDSASKVGDTSRGWGVMRSHATTNRANRRQQHVERF